jgi:glycosyltransferase 2 family protein
VSLSLSGGEAYGGVRGDMEGRARQTVIRRRADVLVLVAGAVVLAASTLAATAPLSAVEIDVFRSVNDLPQSVRPFIWPLMQYGTFITIPVLTVIALVFRRFRLAAAVATSGVGVYLLARVVKQMVDRGRPGAFLDGVHMREVFGEGSLGYPSGHAAVAAALTVVASAYVGTRWTWLALVLAAVVVVGRIYVGAHLPLDLVGGLALGAAAGAIANLILGVPERRDAGRAQPSGQAEQTPGRDEGVE